jgi:hypothetical protein
MLGALLPAKVLPERDVLGQTQQAFRSGADMALRPTLSEEKKLRSGCLPRWGTHAGKRAVHHL